MDVLILNQTFHPDTAATAQHMWDLARYLDRRGHRVTVVSSRVYYGSDRLHERAQDHYGANITVERVSGTGFGKNSWAGQLGRVCDFASFYAAAAVRMRGLARPDVVLALTSPPMISSLAGFLGWLDGRLGRRRPRLVSHVMDLYPEAAVASGVLGERSPAARALGAMAARTLAGSDAVIALGRDMKRRILDRVGSRIPAGRIHVVTPWAEGGQLRPMPKPDAAQGTTSPETFTVVYSGNLGVAHDLDTIAGAIEQTQDDRGICWLFIGGGKRFDSLRARVEQRGWARVRMLPFQPREELNATLNLADVHLVSQLPAFTGIVVPSKLFGILAVGKPSLFVGPAEAECARILAENDAGLIVRNGDVAGLVAAIKRLRDEPSLGRSMGARARAAFEQNYNADICCARIEAILQSVL